MDKHHARFVLILAAVFALEWLVLAVNPHDFAFNDPSKGVYLRSMFKAALQPYEPIVPDEKYSYGDDTLG